MSMTTGGKAQINVTPMIDVLLVLIIIFMVITPVAPHGLKAVVPPQSDIPPEQAADVAREIVISVMAGGGIEINSQTVEMARLGERLDELYRLHLNDHVFVRGDKGLDFQAVAQVIDLVRGAGWERIGLMTK